jgi:glyoxylase-like metal-dependent hydrolase (beta-lactamase superfamily II)
VLTTILLVAHNPGPMTGSGNNTYLVIGSDRTSVLIDAGVGHPLHQAELAHALDVHGVRLTRVLLTHGHADHASGAGEIAAKYPGVRVQKFPSAEMDTELSAASEPLHDGQTIPVGDDHLAVLHTPGHSPDHVVFWDVAARTAFTGDLVVSGSSVMIHSSRGGNLGQYMTSLEAVKRLAPVRLMPGHGPEISDPPAVLQGYLDHRRARERQVLEALSAGRKTVQSIADYIYDGLNPALMPAACENVRAHLEKLEAEGGAVEDHGTWTTSSTSST